MDEEYIQTALTLIMNKLNISSDEFEKHLEFNRKNKTIK